MIRVVEERAANHPETGMPDLEDIKLAKLIQHYAEEQDRREHLKSVR